MRKVFLVLILCICSVAYSQERIFSRGSNGEIVTNSKYIDKFLDGNFPNIKPYTLCASKDITIDKTYTIKLLRYKGWENEPGDFQVIEVFNNNKDLICEIRCDYGWVWMYEEWGTQYKGAPFYSEKLNDDSVMLFFNGVILANQPPLLTILVIENDKCTMVYNKPMFVNKVENINNGVSLTVQDETVEYITPEVQYNFPPEYKLFLKDGLLYFK